MLMDVYLDNQAVTRPDPRVVAAMQAWLAAAGNPQTLHTAGQTARAALDAARAQVAALVGAAPAEVCFVASGSEANNLALKGLAAARAAEGRHLVISAVEHFSVLNAAQRLGRGGFRVTTVPVDRIGRVDPAAVVAALEPDTILVSIQHANPEVGTIQPIREIAAALAAANAARKVRVRFHTDAVQTVGSIPVSIAELGVDLLSLAGSQFHGPLGAAALVVRPGVRLVPQVDGGIQENGRRAGTENLPALVGFGMACQLAAADLAAAGERMRGLRDRLIAGLPQRIPHLYLNGHPTERLPGNVNFSVEFVEGEGMLLLLDGKGIAVSSGSACASKSLKMSHVLAAMGIGPDIGQGSIVCSLSRETTTAEIEYVLAEFPPIVARLREMSPIYDHFKRTGERMAAGPGTDYDHDHDHHDESKED